MEFRNRSTSCPPFTNRTSEVANKSLLVQPISIFPTSDFQRPVNGKLTYQDKIYHKNGDYGGTIYYRCAERNCTARLKYNKTNHQYDITKKHTCITIQSDKPLIHYALKTEVDLFVKENVEYHSNIFSLTPNMIYEALITSLSEKYKNLIYNVPTKNKVR